LSTTDKLFEKLVLRTAQKQYHSMKFQCMRLADHVTLNFNNKMSTAAVFLDIEKAFGTTWNSVLQYKLSELEFSTSPIKLIASFSSLTENLKSFLRQKKYGQECLKVPSMSQYCTFYIKRCLCGTWNSSFSFHRRYLYLHEREKWSSCPLQTAKRPHCSEGVLWALEHKVYWKQNSADLFFL
jgi:hypothetical protein